MFKQNRLKLLGLAVVLLALLAGAGGWVALQALGGQNSATIAVKALNYDDRVRFVVEGTNISILRAEVFDLAGRRIFDSGPVAGNALDWMMTNEEGERVAYGVYLYVITAWDSRGELLKSQVGKLALVLGGVGLGAAPSLTPGREPEDPLQPEREELGQVMPLAYDHTGDWTVSGKLGVGTDTPNYSLHVDGGSSRNPARIVSSEHPILMVKTTTPGNNATFSMRGPNQEWRFEKIGTSFWQVKDVTANTGPFRIYTGAPWGSITIASSGNVGIGTLGPSATLEVHGTAPNLLALYDAANPSSSKFKVQKDGDVYADGSYNCGLSSSCFNAGIGADIAERIDVSELVEPGDVVEIDPDNPGQFRKAREALSRCVAGVISTAPAITLGNNFDPQAEIWEDDRPLLALAGRVPVKATAKYGTIEVGDLLVSSPIPGYAMRCPETDQCSGAILGKALESLEEGTGVIMIQVMLR
jgi:hypothetical protein